MPYPKQLLYLLLLLSGTALAQISTKAITPLSISIEKSTLKKSIVFEATNTSGYNLTLGIDILKPEAFNVLFAPRESILKPGETKLVFIPITIDTYTRAGDYSITLLPIVNGKKQNAGELRFNITIEEFRKITVSSLQGASLLKAGDSIKMTAEIENKGNVIERVSLSSSLNISTTEVRKIGPNQKITIYLNKQTDPGVAVRLKQTHYLKVLPTAGKTVSGYGSLTIYPVRGREETTYKKMSYSASLLHESYSSRGFSQESNLMEFQSQGYVNTSNTKYVQLLLRTATVNNPYFFGNTDQYYLSYREDGRGSIALGDIQIQMTELGVGVQNGFGSKINIGGTKKGFEAFYLKPRGVFKRAEYHSGLSYKTSLSQNFQMKFSVSHAQKENRFNQRGVTPTKRSGNRIATEIKYKNPWIQLQSETVFTSPFNEKTGFGQTFKANIHYGIWAFTSSALYTNSTFFGAVSGSRLLNTQLGIKKNEWNVLLGGTLSNVNRTLDYDFLLPDPYYKQLYLRFNKQASKIWRWRFSGFINQREDKSQLKKYHYIEKGIQYGLRWNRNNWKINLQGSLGALNNKLLSSEVKSLSMFQNFSVQFSPSNRFGIRTALTHTLTNKYQRTQWVSRYLNTSLNAWYSYENWRASIQYTSGFSMEYNAPQRDFLQAELRGVVFKNHHLNLGIHYYEHAFTAGVKSIRAQIGYAIRGGIPIKKLSWKGVLKGRIICQDKAVDLSKIKVSLNGKAVLSNGFGQYLFTSVLEGTQQLSVLEESLPEGYLLKKSNYQSFKFAKNEHQKMDFEIIKAARINTGILSNYTQENKPTLEVTLELKSAEGSYFIATNPEGFTESTLLKPGKYEISVYKKDPSWGKTWLAKSQIITLEAGDNKTLFLDLELKRKNIKMIPNAFKIILL